MSDPDNNVRNLGMTPLQIERRDQAEQALRPMSIDVHSRPLTGPRALARSMLVHPALDELARFSVVQFDDQASMLSESSLLTNAVAMARFEVARVDNWLGGGTLPWTAHCFDFETGGFDVESIEIIRIVYWALRALGLRVTVRVAATGGRVRLRVDHEGVTYPWRPRGGMANWTLQGGIDGGREGAR